MTNKEKTLQLRTLIYDSLTPLLSKQCILLDAPYYHNIGDVLIWTGEKCFFRDNGIHCLYTASYETCTFPLIDSNTTVVFNGGGNLGDIYHEHMEFLLATASRYAHNRIVVCPQTVYYEDDAMFRTDFSQLVKHPNLYFCARDKHVFELLQPFLKDRLLLIPDMAFYIDEAVLNPYKKSVTKDKLIIARNDIEQVKDVNLSIDGMVSDWPVFEHPFRQTTFVNKLFKKMADLKFPLLTAVSNSLWNHYAPVFQKMMIREGVEFISPYKKVETSRLHGCILSILLDKEIILCDNSYGKNRNFYDTWLKDIDKLTLKELK